MRGRQVFSSVTRDTRPLSSRPPPPAPTDVTPFPEPTQHGHPPLPPCLPARRFGRLKGERVFTVTSLETYLKLTGSWNAKTLPKGTYRLTLRSPSGTAQTVEFKIA